MKSEKRCMLIVEPMLSGHHKPYLLNIIRIFKDAGRSVIVLASDEDNDLVIPGVVLIIRKFPILGERSGLVGVVERELRVWLALRKFFREISGLANITEVFMPYLDYCLYAISIFGSPFGSAKYSGITMRPAFHYKKMGVLAPYRTIEALKEVLFKKLLTDGSINQLYTIDETLERYVNRYLPGSKNRIKYLPDPVEYTSVNDCELDQENNLTLTVFGSIDERKGVVELMESLCLIDGPMKVILAGVVKPKVLLRIEEILTRASKAVDVVVINRWISDAELSDLFRCTDVVWLGYKQHYTMSGVLIHAGIRGKFVIGCEDGLIGWYIEQYKMGKTVEIAPISIAKILNNLIEEGVGSVGYDSSQFKYHTWQNFCTIAEDVRSDE